MATREKGWKFFRAKKPDELWQLDIKRPFRVYGWRYWFLVCIDDYSKYLLLCEQFDHEPITKEISSRKVAKKAKKHPYR